MGCNGPVATETRGDDATLLMGCGKATGGEGARRATGAGPFRAISPATPQAPGGAAGAATSANGPGRRSCPPASAPRSPPGRPHRRWGPDWLARMGSLPRRGLGPMHPAAGNPWSALPSGLLIKSSLRTAAPGPSPVPRPPGLLQPPQPPGARGGRGRFRSGRAMARLGREPTDHGGRWQPLCMAGAAEGGGLFLRITNGFGGRARDPARVYRPAVRGFSVAIPCRDF